MILENNKNKALKHKMFEADFYSLLPYVAISNPSKPAIGGQIVNRIIKSEEINLIKNDITVLVHVL